MSSVNISKEGNDVNTKMTKEQGLEHLIVINGERSFVDSKEADVCMDLVVSQDSYLHAGKDRELVVKEAARILKPGGLFVFTDIMQTDGVDPNDLTEVYARIGLDDMGSPAF